jgi:hypothetical protein
MADREAPRCRMLHIVSTRDQNGRTVGIIRPQDGGRDVFVHGSSAPAHAHGHAHDDYRASATVGGVQLQCGHIRTEKMCERTLCDISSPAAGF